MSSDCCVGITRLPMKEQINMMREAMKNILAGAGVILVAILFMYIVSIFSTNFPALFVTVLLIISCLLICFALGIVVRGN